MTAPHTALTVRGFGSYASLILTLGLVSAGFGAVDMAMIAPLGSDHVAAVGQSDVLCAAIFSFFLGLVDAVASRIAVSEGAAETGHGIGDLGGAFLLLLVPCMLVAWLVAASTDFLLHAARQDARLIPLMTDYISWRMYGIAPLLVYFMLSEAMKISGMRSGALGLLCFGFAVNAGLDWAFLYSGIGHPFGSPEGAVAAATVMAHAAMAIAGVSMFWYGLAKRRAPPSRLSWARISAEAASICKVAPGIGARHMNDYAGTVVPLLFIGTLGVETLAAAQVATKIYVLFCRIPQACFGASFAYYGYSVGRSSAEASAIVKRLIEYSAVPTLVAVGFTLAFAPRLVLLLGGDEVNAQLACSMLVAYMWFVPAYFFEQFFGELLTIRQRGAVLFVSSSLATYLITIPLGGIAVFGFYSGFWGIASKGLATFILAVVFWRAIRAVDCSGPMPKAYA